jgi:hypothetical protein
MRGIDGPVRSISRMPTLASGDEVYSVRASCAAMEDLPTPPFPEQIMMMCLMRLNRRETGVSCAVVIDMMKRKIIFVWLINPRLSRRSKPRACQCGIYQPLDEKYSNLSYWDMRSRVGRNVALVFCLPSPWVKNYRLGQLKSLISTTSGNHNFYQRLPNAVDTLKVSHWPLRKDICHAVQWLDRHVCVCTTQEENQPSWTTEI